MRILGIDPGYDRLGIAITEDKSGKVTVLHSECFITSREDTIERRLFCVGEKVSSIMNRYKPDILAIENLFISKNQKTAMRVAEARGIIVYEASRRNIKTLEYTPMQIKTSVTGDGTSDKQRIIKMIGLLTKISKTKAKDDEYDAIAVAITCHANIKNGLSTAG